MEMMQAIYPDFPWQSAMQLHDLCQQSKMWVTKEKQIIKIEDLDKRHAQNILRWLDRRAPHIKLAAEAWWMDTVERHDGGEMAHDSLEDALDEVVEMDADGYLHGTALYKALQEHIA